MRRLGAPFKYRSIIASLEDEVLYSAGAIARHARDHRFLNGTDPKQDMQRVRITLVRLSKNHRFPDQGDGLITLPGQAPGPAWFGRRWKEAVDLPQIQPVKSTWNANQLLAQQGFFLLRETLPLIPLTLEQLRSLMAKQDPSPVTFDTEEHPAVVDMERFARWFAAYWLHATGRENTKGFLESTRATLTICEVHHFYRHTEGALWGVGRDIAKRILGRGKTFTTAQEIIDALTRNGAHQAYEPIDHPRGHEDREYHYDIWLEETGAPRAQCTSFPVNPDSRETGFRIVTGGFAFRKDVAEAMHAIRQRCKRPTRSFSTMAGASRKSRRCDV